ncbi:MAG TPA: winged helix DNA-binding protein [Candidatus Acidoferrum sp.]|nr:winged helix DNA-binding protein [Candidatus Acidoferrum sp.]
MIIVEKKLIPPEILKDSVLVHLAAAYYSLGKQLEQKTKCSQTRGFILSTLRGGAMRNQNQIATLLGFDRTVVHRAIKTMIQEGLLSEQKAESGRALLVQLTTKGNKYREHLIKVRQTADEKLRQELSADDIAALLRLLKVVAEVKF